MTKCTGAAKYVLTGVIAATIFLPSAGFAQQTAASEESDEIIVTARKVTERLSDVATSIAVLDQRTLSERGLTDVASLNSVVTNFRSEEHTSELQSLMRISYAVFCLKKKKKKRHNNTR